MIETTVPAINALEKMQHGYSQFGILEFLLAHFENIKSENTNDNRCQPFSSKAFKTKVTDCRIPTTKIIQDDSVGYLHGLGIMQHGYRHLKIAECSRGQGTRREMKSTSENHDNTMTKTKRADHRVLTKRKKCETHLSIGNTRGHQKQHRWEPTTAQIDLVKVPHSSATLLAQKFTTLHDATSQQWQLMGAQAAYVSFYGNKGSTIRIIVFQEVTPGVVCTTLGIDGLLGTSSNFIDILVFEGRLTHEVFIASYTGGWFEGLPSLMSPGL